MRAKHGDALRVCRTAIVILLFCSLHARAEYDLNVGGTLRSYPLSGTLEVIAGYGFPLWGTVAAGSPWYGYLRPQLDLNTAATYNAADVGLELYPLSILGGRVGGEAIQNDQRYRAYDCATYDCRGRFYRAYAQADLTLGAGDFFGQVRWKRERWSRAKSSARRFVEPTSAFALAGDGDAESVYRASLGYKLNAEWTALAVLIYAATDSDHGVSRFPFGVLRYTKGPWSAAAGLGVFSSPLAKEQVSALAYLNWEIKPSLALH